MADQIVNFLRKKDFILKGELGRGACGQTVLLYDEVIEETFVCKKYSPLSDALREDLFKNFLREIKLLHLANHVNVVRVFNYYLYPEQFLGYIVMEYVQGLDIEDFLSKSPEDVNEIFIQVIEGFSHLESQGILHRDIRPQNIMVGVGGVVKIIDLGFGKQTVAATDFDKSITLNWWCEPPQEFGESIYDYQTEIYFVGKLFEKMILEKNLGHFKYKNLLGRMCAINPTSRAISFSDIRKEIFSNKFADIEFEAGELEAYREFSNTLFRTVNKIESNTKYYNDIADIQIKLEDLHKKVMLEEYIPNGSLVLKLFISSSYYFNANYFFPVSTLEAFVDLLRSSSREKKNIILSNIQTRLDAVQRYDKSFNDMDDDIPF